MSPENPLRKKNLKIKPFNDVSMNNEYIIEQIRKISYERKQTVRKTVDELSQKIAILYAQQRVEGSLQRDGFTAEEKRNNETFS